MFYTEEENTNYEIFESSMGKKIIIYLEKVEKDFVITGKPFGTHLLEQIFDHNDNLISHEVKLNPHKMDMSWIHSIVDGDYD